MAEATITGGFRSNADLFKHGETKTSQTPLVEWPVSPVVVSLIVAFKTNQQKRCASIRNYFAFEVHVNQWSRILPVKLSKTSASSQAPLTWLNWCFLTNEHHDSFYINTYSSLICIYSCILPLQLSSILVLFCHGLFFRSTRMEISRQKRKIATETISEKIHRR